MRVLRCPIRVRDGTWNGIGGFMVFAPWFKGGKEPMMYGQPEVFVRRWRDRACAKWREVRMRTPEERQAAWKRALQR